MTDKLETGHRSDSFMDEVDELDVAVALDFSAMEQVASRVEKDAQSSKGKDREPRATTPKSAKYIHPNSRPKPAPSGQLKDQEVLPKQKSLESIAADILENEADETPHTEYPESYASVADLNDVKSDIVALKHQVAEIQQAVEAMLVERKAVPEHLDRIQAKFTRDMTLLLERIADGQREGSSTTGPTGAVSAGVAKAAAAAIGQDTREEMTALENLLHKAPETTGPLVSTSVTLTGRRRFKPTK